MRTFWRFLLRKNLPPDSLSSVTFAAFGLGDSGKPAIHSRPTNVRLWQTIDRQRKCWRQ